jgi:hypothetical protein
MPYLKIDVDADSTIEDIEAELEHWSEQLAISIEIGDTETKGYIMKAIRWLNECLTTLENELEEQQAAKAR